MSKRLEVLGAVLVFLGIALAFYLERPEPADSSLFGAEMALVPELAPLAAPGGALELSGVVRTSAGTPAADAFLVLLRSEDDPSEAEPLYHAYTDGEGRFAFSRLTAGAYRAVLTHPSAPPRTLSLELPVSGEVSWELAAPTPPLPGLPELRRLGLAGRLRMPETLASGALELRDFEVILAPAGDTPLLAGACERRALTDAEGRFLLEELVVASYRVEVLPPWARGGSWPVLARGTCTPVEGRADPLELLLEVGALEGELREDEGRRPLAGALVRVAALAAPDPVGQPQLWPPAVTDALGRYRVELLPPGRYLVHFRAGAAARDVEVVVETNRRTSVPLGIMEPRAGAGAAGG